MELLSGSVAWTLRARDKERPKCTCWGYSEITDAEKKSQILKCL